MKELQKFVSYYCNSDIWAVQKIFICFSVFEDVIVLESFACTNLKKTKNKHNKNIRGKRGKNSLARMINYNA